MKKKVSSNGLPGASFQRFSSNLCPFKATKGFCPSQTKILSHVTNTIKVEKQ